MVQGNILGSLIAASSEFSGNCPRSRCFSHPVRMGLPAGAGPGRARPAKLDAAAGLCSAPSAQAAVILAAGFIGRQECSWRALPACHARALPACGCVAGRYGEGDASPPTGGGGGERTPPPCTGKPPRSRRCFF